jgi:hypothetical protein
MGRFIGALVVIVLVIVGLGYYLNWFHVATTDGDTTTNINVTVDKEKIKEDKEKAKEKLEEAGHRLKKEAENALDKGKHASEKDSSNKD